jgi:RNA polymerase sigma factor (sigma-70 family)
MEREDRIIHTPEEAVELDSFQPELDQTYYKKDIAMNGLLQVAECIDNQDISCDSLNKTDTVNCESFNASSSSRSQEANCLINYYRRSIMAFIETEPFSLDAKTRSNNVNTLAVFLKNVIELDLVIANDPILKRMYDKAYTWLDIAMRPAKAMLYRRFQGNSRYDRDDLTQAIHQAMLKSILPNYDPLKAGFYTYFNQAAWINATRFVTKHESHLSIPEHFFEKDYSARTPELVELIKNSVSINESVGDKSDSNLFTGGLSIQDYLETGDEFNVANLAEHHEVLEIVFEAIEKECTDSEKLVIEHCWLGGVSQEQIGKELGYSQMHISRLSKKARLKITKTLVEKGYNDLAYALQK